MGASYRSNADSLTPTRKKGLWTELKVALFSSGGYALMISMSISMAMRDFIFL